MVLITTITELEKDRLDFEIDMCLKMLYKLEDMTMCEEKAISECIDLLQDIEVRSIGNELTKFIEEAEEE